MVAQEDFFDKDIVNDKNKNKYFVINKGDFVYNPRKSIQAPYGPINLLENYESGIVSPLYTCFTVQKDYTTFLKWYFKSNKWYKYIYINGDKGARGDRVSIKDSVFYGLTLYAPYKSEMNKIDNFLSAIDEKINVLSMKISTLKKYKKGIVDEWFDKHNETKKLSDLVISKTSQLLTSQIKDNQGNFVVYDASGSTYKTIDFFSTPTDSISIIKYGSGCGRTFVAKGRHSVLGTMTELIPNSQIDLLYLYAFTTSKYFKSICVKYTEVGTTPNLYYSDYSKADVYYPKRRDIFIKLIKCLLEFEDDLENKLTKLKTIKSFLLNILFI